MWDVKSDSKIGKRVGLWMRRIFGPQGREPKKAGSGYVVDAVQRRSKTASKAAENSGQSLRNLLCTSMIFAKIMLIK